MGTAVMWVFWGLAGWCGTKPPRPLPGPNPFKRIIVGVVGGLIGGFLFNWAFPFEGTLTGLDVAPTLLGAWIFGKVLYDVIDPPERWSG